MSCAHLKGFFLRLRLGKWDEGLGGTGYYVACITGINKVLSCLFILYKFVDRRKEPSVSLLSLITNFCQFLSLFCRVLRGAKRDKFTSGLQKFDFCECGRHQLLGWESIYLQPRFPWGKMQFDLLFSCFDCLPFFSKGIKHVTTGLFIHFLLIQTWETYLFIQSRHVI